MNNFGGGNQERQMYVDSPEFADMDYSQWAPGELHITAKRKMKSRQVIHGAYPGIYQCYALGWDATGISWWVNGFETFSVEMAKTFDQKFHLIINLAVGGAFPGMEPDPDWQQSDFRIHDLVVETPV